LNRGVGDFVALANASLAIVGSFMSIALVFPELGKHRLFAQNILELLQYENTVASLQNAPPPDGSEYSIEYKNVGFSYPFDKDKTVLHNINFHIEKNKRIALVGCNGSGKTTLIKLLLRLYDVSEGEIFLGGKNIKEYDLSGLRNSYGLLFQDFQQFPITIGENVLMREIETEQDEQLVWDALKKAGISEKIKECRNGIYTKLTKEFDETGVSFSGGEIQKLMLARVFAQKQKILVLDEPSSALDALSENFIFDEIFNNVSDKTVIFITHRLGAAKNADEIILLKDGAIIEKGTHKELMELNGEYAQMYGIQSQRYIIDPEEKMSF
jgi:ATP-binding cassette subfamily B protein